MSRLTECSLVITKASLDPKSGEMRFSASASDTQKDSYGESMSLALFKDFIARAEKQERPPDDFCSDYWSGGLPYVSIAHYSDLDGSAVPGKLTSLYIDGNVLKAKGIFFDDPLGKACFKSIRESLAEKSREDKVRISIGFLDYAHRHGNVLYERKSTDEQCQLCMRGIGDKVYMSGHLIHLALTRIPVNKRTDIEPEDVIMKSDGIRTKLDDASSIIGDDLAKEIDSQSVLIGKSELVTKSEEDVVSAEEVTAEVPDQESHPAEVELVETKSEAESFEEKVLTLLSEIQMAMSDKKKKMMDEEDDEMMDDEEEGKGKKKKVKSIIADALETFSSAFDETYSQPATVDAKLQMLQNPLNALGMSIRSAIETSVKEEVDVTPVAPNDVNDLPSLVSSAVAKAIATELGPLVEQMKAMSQREIVSKSGIPSAASEMIPQPRNISPALVQQSVSTKKLSQIEELAKRSVGLL